MSIGMTYDEFWNCDPILCRYYRKADEYKRKRRNEELWLQGAYIYERLCDSSPLFRTQFTKGKVKPNEYSKEPYPITEMEIEAKKQRERQLKEERMKAEFSRFVANLKIRKAE